MELRPTAYREPVSSLHAAHFLACELPVMITGWHSPVDPITSSGERGRPERRRSTWSASAKLDGVWRTARPRHTSQHLHITSLKLPERLDCSLERGRTRYLGVLKSNASCFVCERVRRTALVWRDAEHRRGWRPRDAEPGSGNVARCPPPPPKALEDDARRQRPYPLHRAGVARLLDAELLGQAHPIALQLGPLMAHHLKVLRIGVRAWRNDRR